MSNTSANEWVAWGRGLIRKAREIENRIRTDNEIEEYGLNDTEHGESLDAEGIQDELERWVSGNLAARRQALRQSQLNVDTKPGLSDSKEKARAGRIAMATGWVVTAELRPDLVIEAIAALSELASHASEYSLEVVCSDADSHPGLGQRATGFVRCRKYENEFCHGYDLEALQLVRNAADGIFNAEGEDAEDRENLAPGFELEHDSEEGITSLTHDDWPGAVYETAAPDPLGVAYLTRRSWLIHDEMQKASGER